MDTALYYTFSTIAQALAGAIAFLAAVVLFKLQGIDSALKELADTIEDAFGVGNELISAHYAQGHWDEMLSAIPAGAFNDDIRRRAACRRMHALLQGREKLVARLKLSVPLTLGVTIAARRRARARAGPEIQPLVFCPWSGDRCGGIRLLLILVPESQRFECW